MIVGNNESGVVGIAMDVGNCDGIVKGVRWAVVFAPVTYGMLLHRAVPAYGGCEVSGVLCDTCCQWWVCLEDGLLEGADAV